MAAAIRNRAELLDQIEVAHCFGGALGGRQVKVEVKIGVDVIDLLLGERSRVAWCEGGALPQRPEFGEGKILNRLHEKWNRCWVDSGPDARFNCFECDPRPFLMLQRGALVMPTAFDNLQLFEIKVVMKIRVETRRG